MNINEWWMWFCPNMRIIAFVICFGHFNGDWRDWWQTKPQLIAKLNWFQGRDRRVQTMSESHLRRSWLLPGLSYLRLVHVFFYISFTALYSLCRHSLPAIMTNSGRCKPVLHPIQCDTCEIMFLFSYRNPLCRWSFDAFFDWLFPGCFSFFFPAGTSLKWCKFCIVLSWRVAKLRHAKCKHWFGDHCLGMGWTWPCLNWEFWLQRLFMLILISKQIHKEATHI